MHRRRDGQVRHNVVELRVDVTDTRTERRPSRVLPPVPVEEESGRGLILIDALATNWGMSPRTAAPGKTVWLPVDLVAFPS